MKEILSKAFDYFITLMTTEVMVMDVLLFLTITWAIKTLIDMLKAPQTKSKVTGKTKITNKDKIRSAIYSPKQFRRKKDDW